MVGSLGLSLTDVSSGMAAQAPVPNSTAANNRPLLKKRGAGGNLPVVRSAPERPGCSPEMNPTDLANMIKEGPISCDKDCKGFVIKGKSYTVKAPYISKENISKTLEDKNNLKIELVDSEVQRNSGVNLCHYKILRDKKEIHKNLVISVAPEKPKA